MPRSLLWPDPRVKPPFGAAEVDWGHPLAAALDLLFLCNESGGNLHSLARDGEATHTGTWGPRGCGVTALTNGSSTGAILEGTPRVTNVPLTLSHLGVAPSPNIFTTTPYAIIALANTGSMQNSFGLGLQANSGVGNYPQVWSYASDGFRSATGTTTFTGSSGKPYHMHGVIASITSRIVYLDGRAEGSDAISATISGINTFGLGILNRSAPSRYQSDFSTVWLWGRAFSADHVLWHAAEPYAMLRPIVRRRYFVLAGGIPTLVGKRFSLTGSRGLAG